VKPSKFPNILVYDVTLFENLDSLLEEITVFEKVEHVIKVETLAVVYQVLFFQE
jgi:hypothetical protein